MRWVLKIILSPISLALSILTAFLTFLLAIGPTILYLLMLMCIVVGVVSLFQKDFSIGIEALILGFLLSPYGIPMVGAAVIAFLQGINKVIWNSLVIFLEAKSTSHNCRSRDNDNEGSFVYFLDFFLDFWDLMS